MCKSEWFRPPWETVRAAEKQSEVSRADAPTPEPAPEPLKDAPDAARKARARAQQRALSTQGVGATQTTGSGGLPNAPSLQRKTALGQ